MKKYVFVPDKPFESLTREEQHAFLARLYKDRFPDFRSDMEEIDPARITEDQIRVPS